jgi:hypothetical protein
MPKCYWVPVLATIGWIATSASTIGQDFTGTVVGGKIVATFEQNKVDSEKNEDTNQNGSMTETIGQALERIGDALTELVPEVNEEKEKRTETRELRDLQAQEDMAAWAERMFWATLASLGISFVGVVLVWRSLKLNRETLEQATKASNAAVETNATARELGEAQTRAYVDLFDVQIKNYGEDRPAAEVLYGGKVQNDVVLIFKNSGQSPASSVTIRFRRKIVGHMTLETFDASLEGVDATAPAKIAAGQTFGKNVGSVQTDAEYKSITSGECYDVIFGDIVYEDVFKKKIGPIFFRVLGRDLGAQDRRFVPF